MCINQCFIATLEADKRRIEDELENSRVCLNTPEIRRNAVRIGTCSIVDECVCDSEGRPLGDTKESIKHIVGWREYYTDGKFVTGIPYTTPVEEALSFLKKDEEVAA